MAPVRREDGERRAKELGAVNEAPQPSSSPLRPPSAPRIHVGRPREQPAEPPANGSHQFVKTRLLQRSVKANVLGLTPQNQLILAVKHPNGSIADFLHEIDPEVLKHMTPSAVGFRAPNPRTTLRNQLDRMSIVNTDGTALAAPKFLREKNRGASSEIENERRISDAEVFTKPELAGSTKANVPVMYRLMEIRYSRYGLDYFDFEEDPFSIADFIHEI
ncbi:MAG: hypothetical protein L6R42_002286, partial [Xanthoria sp. 1 TBL-2021]